MLTIIKNNCSLEESVLVYIFDLLIILYIPGRFFLKGIYLFRFELLFLLSFVFKRNLKGIVYPLVVSETNHLLNTVHQKEYITRRCS